jgi:hypothetical protein
VLTFCKKSGILFQWKMKTLKQRLRAVFGVCRDSRKAVGPPKSPCVVLLNPRVPGSTETRPGGDSDVSGRAKTVVTFTAGAMDKQYIEVK